VIADAAPGLVTNLAGFALGRSVLAGLGDREADSASPRPAVASLLAARIRR
jgi:hypothetical protein